MPKLKNENEAMDIYDKLVVLNTELAVINTKLKDQTNIIQKVDILCGEINSFKVEMGVLKTEIQKSKWSVGIIGIAITVITFLYANYTYSPKELENQIIAIQNVAYAQAEQIISLQQKFISLKKE